MWRIGIERWNEGDGDREIGAYLPLDPDYGDRMDLDPPDEGAERSESARAYSLLISTLEKVR